MKQSNGSALPSFIVLGAVTQTQGTFTITPVDNALAGTYTLQFEVTDDDSYGTGTMQSCTYNFDVVITKVNAQCNFGTPLVDKSVIVESTLAYAMTAVSDADTADSHTKVATLLGGGALPGFITFNDATFSFSFAPTLNSEAGTYDIRVVVTDNDFHSSGGVQSCEDNFRLTVGTLNHQPSFSSSHTA